MSHVLIHIDPNRGIPYYRQVKEQITQMILSGQLAPGSRLESVAHLSKRLRVNPMTISKAYSFMVEEKIVERRAGIGVFVAHLPEGKKREMTHSLLATLLNRAAILSIQMGMEQAEAESMFGEEFKKIQSQQEKIDE